MEPPAADSRRERAPRPPPRPSRPSARRLREQRRAAETRGVGRRRRRRRQDGDARAFAAAARRRRVRVAAAASQQPVEDGAEARSTHRRVLLPALGHQRVDRRRAVAGRRARLTAAAHRVDQLAVGQLLERPRRRPSAVHLPRQHAVRPRVARLRVAPAPLGRRAGPAGGSRRRRAGSETGRRRTASPAATARLARRRRRCAPPRRGAPAPPTPGSPAPEPPGPGPILSVFSALIVHSELKSVHPGFPVAFIF